MERDRPEPTWQELVKASDAGRSAPERAAELCQLPDDKDGERAD